MEINSLKRNAVRIGMVLNDQKRGENHGCSDKQTYKN